MDEQRLEAGSDWRADIGNGILNASIISMYACTPTTTNLCLVFLVSPVSVVSDWCIKELNMGRNNGKLVSYYIILLTHFDSTQIWPARYQGAEVPLTVSSLFSIQQHVDLSTDDSFVSAIATLVTKLKSTLSKSMIVILSVL